ncbi:hypothetical protein I8748_08790 [Nostoc sp. CENA67]|uniref:Uncharacterized protein n=1 Tax=Amazonocrinis nigriterrae CENA67 TaxID=2794033 RepID=A0A8J7HMA9_9NOST|nr:hypothetical protein [Amazonocrinis nigriterrae CENA67]
MCRQSQGRIKHLLFLSSLVISITSIYPTSAHEIKVAADVGATLHMEPNDNPRAGESTQAWFALTRKGGKQIPLSQCDCQLFVYAEPHTPKEPALLEPSLKPVVAERYQGIPGADIIFPKPGIYQLQLSGKPATGANFKPFTFKFEVVVAAGAASNTQKSQDVNNAPTQETNTGLGLIVTALCIILGTGILVFWVKAARKSGKND